MNIRNLMKQLSDMMESSKIASSKNTSHLKNQCFPSLFKYNLGHLLWKYCIYQPSQLENMLFIPSEMWAFKASVYASILAGSVGLFYFPSYHSSKIIPA